MGGGGGAVDGITAKRVTKGQEYFAFGLVTSLFFLWGFSYGLVDVLNKHFQTFFGISHLQSTAIQIAYFGAYIVWSPCAGQFMSRWGYKKGIYMGLSLYIIGALMFWPMAKFETFPGFVAAAFVIACGLSTLEVAANSYVTVLGSPEQAAFRLNFSQSFNGLAAFTGPLIASKYFFSGDNATSLGTVQYVYLAVACLGAAVMILFFFATLPEISETAMADAQASVGFVDDRPLYKRMHTVLGFVTQFCYVGAQVTVASFFLNYLTDDGDYDSETAAQIFSYAQITFMVARFASTPILRFFEPATLLMVYGSMTAIFCLAAALTGGKAGLGCLFVVFFFESIIYPTVFTLATSNLGSLTKRGAGLLCMGVGGGAAFPPMQGALADSKNAIISYVIPFIGFSVVTAYGVGMTIYGKRMKKKLGNVVAPSSIAVLNNQIEKTLTQERIDEEKYDGSPVHVV